MADLLVPKDPDTTAYTTILEKLDCHYGTKISVWGERMLFYEAQQRNNEPVNEWAVRVRHLSVNCKFGNYLNEALRDKFIFGLQKGHILEKILQEDPTEVSFTRAVELAEGLEVAKSYYRSVFSDTQIKEEPQIYKVSTSEECVQNSGQNVQQALYSQRQRKYFKNKNEVFTGNEAGSSSSFKKQPSRPESGANMCGCCGKLGHPVEICRYRNYTCYCCGVKGHLSNTCKNSLNVSKKNAYFLKLETQDKAHKDAVKNDDFLHVFKVETVNKNVPIKINVDLQGINIDMELDSGSAVTAISSDLFEKYFSNLPLNTSKLSLISYSGEKIDPAGVVSLDLTYNNNTCKLEVFVIKKGGPPLLGRDFMNKFNLGIQQIKYVASEQDFLSNFEIKYKEVFSEGVGTFTMGQIKIKLKPNVQAKFFKPRALPYALKDKVEQELNRLVSLRILTPIEFSNWGTPIVPVLKSDGTVRICGDYKITLNQAIEIDRFPIPRIEDLFTQLQGGITYSKIDLSQAYQQVLLDNDSKLLTTISTHKGLFYYNRLPFGISIGPSAFQRIIERVRQGISGVVCFQDDILITCKNMFEHKSSLNEVFSRLKKCGLKVQTSKCVFFQEQVSYLGYILNKNGIMKSQEKINAILNAPAPKDKLQLQSFLGLINYYRKFVPNMASLAHPLYNLLKNDVIWDWSEKCVESFKKLKEIMASDNILVHYNPALKVKLTCDASSY